MSHEADIQSVLQADTTFDDLMTGGIYTYDETGRNGISPQSTETAYQDGTLLPCVVIKERSLVPTNAIRSEASRDFSYRATVELWFYQDGAASLDTLDTASRRAIALLHDQRVTGAKVHLNSQLKNFRDPDLEGAHVLRLEFLVHAVHIGE